MLAESVVDESGRSDYRYTGRFSMASGVPTVLSWPAHEEQWRGSAGPLASREQDIDVLYRTEDPGAAGEIIAKYGIDSSRSALSNTPSTLSLRWRSSRIPGCVPTGRRHDLRYSRRQSAAEDVGQRMPALSKHAARPGEVQAAGNTAAIAARGALRRRGARHQGPALPSAAGSSIGVMSSPEIVIQPSSSPPNAVVQYVPNVPPPGTGRCRSP